MANRTLVAVREDRQGKVHHYFSDGWVVVWKGPHRWDAWQVPDPERVTLAGENPDMEPNRELAPEVCDD